MIEGLKPLAAHTAESEDSWLPPGSLNPHQLTQLHLLSRFQRPFHFVMKL
jgi:hypothetical protein